MSERIQLFWRTTSLQSILHKMSKQKAEQSTFQSKQDLYIRLLNNRADCLTKALSKRLFTQQRNLIVFSSESSGIRGGVGKRFVGEIMNKMAELFLKTLKCLLIISQKTPTYWNGPITIDPSGKVSWEVSSTDQK